MDEIKKGTFVIMRNSGSYNGRIGVVNGYRPKRTPCCPYSIHLAPLEGENFHTFVMVDENQIEPYFWRPQTPYKATTQSESCGQQ